MRRSLLADFRHHQRGFNAAGGSHKGQCDARIAAGGFQNDGIGFDLAVAFRRIQHGGANAVLDGVGGIVEFKFCDDLGDGAFGDAVQANERGVADQVGDVVGDFHEKLLNDGWLLNNKPVETKSSGRSPRIPACGVAVHCFDLLAN